MSLKSGLEMIQRRRPEADPIPAFRAILEDYETKCIQEREATTGKSSSSTMTGASLEETKQKKRAGPSGPAPLLPVARDDSLPVQPNDKRRKIGPVMGPSIAPTIENLSSVADSGGATSKKVIGPAMPSPALAHSTKIGPSLPPPTIEEKQETVTSIGPSMPPGVVSETKASTGSVTIGPSLPPPSS